MLYTLESNQGSSAAIFFVDLPVFFFPHDAVDSNIADIKVRDNTLFISLFFMSFLYGILLTDFLLRIIDEMNPTVFSQNLYRHQCHLI